MVMLDPKQNLEECHRHFSHLMCLYPLHLINYDTEENKNIYEKTMLHLERLGNGWWIGFSYPMCAQIYAMMHNGNAAYEKLRTFCRGFIADNAFHLSGDFKKYGFCQWHYRPFTLESTFGYCDALQEMLLQDNNGYIETFGAMPDDWRQASFKNLRSYGGILVSAEYKDGRTSKITLSARKKTSVRILNGFGTDALIVRCGGEEKAIKAQTGAAFEITFSGKATINPKNKSRSISKKERSTLC
jgi:alpha-L-fucosidase 2